MNEANASSEEKTGRHQFPETWRTSGTSMLPFVPPSSVLHLRKKREGETIRRGEIVCYLGPNGKIVAHRISGSEQTSGRLMYSVSGDAYKKNDFVEEAAVIGVVTRVDFGPVSYSTKGVVGKTAATFARRAPTLLAIASFASRITLNMGTKAASVFGMSSR